MSTHGHTLNGTCQHFEKHKFLNHHILTRTMIATLDFLHSHPKTQSCSQPPSPLQQQILDSHQSASRTKHSTPLLSLLCQPRALPMTEFKSIELYDNLEVDAGAHTVEHQAKAPSSTSSSRILQFLNPPDSLRSKFQAHKLREGWETGWRHGLTWLVHRSTWVVLLLIGVLSCLVALGVDWAMESLLEWKLHMTLGMSTGLV